MVPGLFAAAFGLALMDWTALVRRNMRLMAFTKAGVMLALIAWFSLAGGWRGPLFAFGLALVFSLLGDVFLLSNRLFIPGLLAFLAAHAAYIVALSAESVLVGSPLLLLVAVPAGLAAVWVYRIVRQGLERSPKSAALKLPVLVYSLALTVMAVMALITPLREGWISSAALLVAVGGVLFFISDSILAINRFTRPVHNGQLLIHITYHLAQFALAAGAVINYA